MYWAFLPQLMQFKKAQEVLESERSAGYFAMLGFRFEIEVVLQIAQLGPFHTYKQYFTLRDASGLNLEIDVVGYGTEFDYVVEMTTAKGGGLRRHVAQLQRRMAAYEHYLVDAGQHKGVRGLLVSGGPVSEDLLDTSGWDTYSSTLIPARSRAPLGCAFGKQRPRRDRWRDRRAIGAPPCGPLARRGPNPP